MATKKKAAKPAKTEKEQPTIESLIDKIKFQIFYIGIEKDTDFLILGAKTMNGNIPVLMPKGDTFQVPVTQKFINALQKLRYHAGAVVGLPTDDLDKFNVTSVHFKYGKRGDSFQMNCTFTTPFEKAFNYTTPIEYLNEDAENAYDDIAEVLKIRKNLFERVEKYLSGEERKDVNAIGMFAGELTEAQIAANGKENDVTDKYKK